MKLPSAVTKSPYWQSMNSPLVHRISLVVFLCIVLIEAVLLVTSYYAERDRLLTRIDYSLELIVPVFESTEDYGVFDTLVEGQHEEISHPLIGLVIRSNDSKAYYQAGDPEGLREKYLGGPRRTRFDSRTGIYETYLGSHDGDSYETQAWFRVDARQVSADLTAYIWRVIGIVLLICGFVTVGCVLALNPILIRPLFELRLQILATRRNGLGSFNAPEKALLRKDELGDVYREFDRMQHALIEAESVNTSMRRRFKDFADLGADCFWEVDRALRFTFIAGDVNSLFGYDADQILGFRLDKLSQQEDFPFPCSRDVAMALIASSSWEGELEFPANPGRESTVRIMSKRLYREDGAWIGMRGTVTNTTVASKLAHDLNYMASHDALTGLHNRRHFDQLLQQSMEGYKQTEKKFCVCLLDLDRFKLVNDSCGHAAGDRLLTSLSDIISEHVREQDVVSRYGGDEFTLLLNGCALNDGYKICESIRQAISAFRFSWGGRTYDVGVSIGVTEISSEFENAHELMRATDACCYKAKHLGRNQVRAYSKEDTELSQSISDQQWMQMISEGLAKDRFMLYQQPIRKIKDHRANRVHFEVLLRMADEDGRIYTPESFMHAAERYGLMEPLDRWVLKTVIAWLQSQDVTADVDLLIHINLSGVASLDSSFQNFLIEEVQAANINPAHLCFEFKENMVVQNAKIVGGFIKSVRELGCKIALDDFGTGMSALGYMKRLPVDYLKIDGLFVREITQNPLDSVLVKCIAEVARVLGVQTVAEFVETEETLALLAELGVDMAQGFVVHEPEVLSDLCHYLETLEAIPLNLPAQKAG